MTHKRIISELQKNGSATARVLARTLSIDNKIAISVLNNLEQQGRVTQLNGYWFLPDTQPVPGKNKKKP